MDLSSVLNGNYAGWQGLPLDISLAELEAALQPVTGVVGPEEQQRTYRRFYVTHFSRPVPPYEVDAWCVFGEDTVTIVEYANPPIQDLEGTLQDLGLPDLLAADQRYAVGLRVQDYVYASRGITFSIGEPFPPAPPLPRSAVYLLLYPAKDIQYYVTDIGPGVPKGPDVGP